MMNAKDRTHTLDWLPQKRKVDEQGEVDSANTKKFVFKDGKENDELLYIVVWILIQFCIVIALFFLIANSSGTRTSGLHRTGVQLTAQGKYDEAIECYTKGIAIDPHYTPFYLARGECHETKGDFSAALADYDQACRYFMADIYVQDRKNALCLRLAETEILTGDLPKALEYYIRSLEISDYNILDWRTKLLCQYRLRTYVARKQCLENSEEPVLRLLAKADSYWMEVNSAYRFDDRNLEEILRSLDQDCVFLLSFAEWHYGQENYALALECLRRSIAKTEFAQLPADFQETFHNLKGTLEKMLEEGVPPGVFSHTSSLLGISIAAPPLPVAVPVPENESTELSLPHE